MVATWSQHFSVWAPCWSLMDNWNMKRDRCFSISLIVSKISCNISRNFKILFSMKCCHSTLNSLNPRSVTKIFYLTDQFQSNRSSIISNAARNAGKVMDTSKYLYRSSEVMTEGHISWRGKQHTEAKAWGRTVIALSTARWLGSWTRGKKEKRRGLRSRKCTKQPRSGPRNCWRRRVSKSITILPNRPSCSDRPW